MSTIREHLGLLWLSRRALMTSNPHDDPAWAWQAAYFIRVHLNDLIELTGGADLEGWARERAGEIPADFPHVAPTTQQAAKAETGVQEVTPQAERPDGCWGISADTSLKTVTLRFDTSDQVLAYYGAVNAHNTAATTSTSRREAIAGAVARGWCTPENASKVLDNDLALAIVAEVEAELASRGRAQGGNTDTESGSDIATTTSTVSAPIVQELAQRLESLGVTNFSFTPGPNATPETVAAEISKALDQLAAPSSPEGAQKAPEDVRNQAAGKQPVRVLGPGNDVVSAAAYDVLAERRRQVEVEGWTPEHDDEHADDSLVMAAICYALPESRRGERPQDVVVMGGRVSRPYGVPTWWPESWCATWWKPKDRRRDLVRSCALILSDIERIDRAALRTSSTDQANADTPASKGE